MSTSLPGHAEAHLAGWVSEDEHESGSFQGGVLPLLASDGADDVRPAVGRTLTVLGWKSHDSAVGSPTCGTVLEKVRDCHSTLTFMGALDGDGVDARPATEGDNCWPELL